MKKILRTALLCAGVIPVMSNAQSVDFEKYPDYSSELNPDYSLLENSVVSRKHALKSGVILPDHVNNAEYKYFPPVFNQSGGSCGSASRICYMFTHEINSYRDADGKLLSNRYPSHFVWLLTNGNSGKGEFVTKIGVPSADIYGGTTYSQLFGNQNEKQNDFGWMQGYDKWYAAMWNRMSSCVNFPINVSNEEGRQALKRWLYNHNGDTDFHSGGIAGIGVAASGKWHSIPSTPANDEIGVTGKKFVYQWGTQVNHALTIVGYDDRIEFDLNGNGVFGESDADERGAWIIVNSWGKNWCNDGFIYCPYAYGGKSFSDKNGELAFNRNWWFPEVYHVRKDYRPLQTIKIKMDYSRRSELCLGAGISSDINSEKPERTIQFEHFKFAGDGNRGNTQPAPEIPMLGKWADGKLHDEPMEFGYDLTDLSAQFDKGQPLKYFFIIETKDWAEGNGHIYNASILNYEKDEKGIETPFPIQADGVKIRNKGNKTIISTIVYEEQYNAPLNFILNGEQLTWNAPDISGHELECYQLYYNGINIATLDKKQHSYNLTNVQEGTYEIQACYEGNKLSKRVYTNTHVKASGINRVANFHHSGFSISELFKHMYDEATIEYWIKPHSLCDYNQNAKSSNNTFKIHANADGSLTAGWNKDNNCATTKPGLLKTNVWTHVAVTIKKNLLTIYINGLKSTSVTSNQHEGIGGFEQLIFQADHKEKSTDACIDELRIWNYAKSSMEVLSERGLEYNGPVYPTGLIAYFKGDIFNINEKPYLRDYISNHHAKILNNQYEQKDDADKQNYAPADRLTLDVIVPKQKIYAGVSALFTTNHSQSINQLEWKAETANCKELINIAEAALIFSKAGKHTVTVTGSNDKGQTMTTSATFNVEEAPAPNAEFISNKNIVSVDERLSLTVRYPMRGYVYYWELPGSKITDSHDINVSTSYPQKGNYKVKLTVKSPNGKKSCQEQEIQVKEIAPIADFEITPAIIRKGETTFLKDQSLHRPNQWQWILQNGQRCFVINGQNSSWTPTIPGVYDIQLIATNNAGSNKVYKRSALTVCNADSKNGLNFTETSQQVVLNKPVFPTATRSFTIDWWMNAKQTSKCNGIGEDGSFVLQTGKDGVMSFFIRSNPTNSDAHYVLPNEWHHYAVTFLNGNVKFYRDGSLICSRKTGSTSIPELKSFTISSAQAPLIGQIDEFRIWKQALEERVIQQYANTPIVDIARAESDYRLAVYYDFNQSEGDVIDRTSQHNDGRRLHFGPDGDAWGLSEGVFAINMDKVDNNSEVTDKYLKNYHKAFRRDGNKLVNPSQSPRFGAIADWTLENTTINGDIITGVHVDQSKESCFTYASGWDGFGELNNHKAYQTMTLPAGMYTFIAYYGRKTPGKCGDSYIVAAKGKGLPNTSDLTAALGYAKMQPKSGNCMKNVVNFILTEETEISLGLLINQRDFQCCSIEKFELLHNNIEFVEADNAAGYDLTIDGTGYSTLYLPYPVFVPEGTRIYSAKTVSNQKVFLEEITEVVPCNTGVIVHALPGTYHFAPTSSSSEITSVLYGVTKDTPTNGSENKYYSFDAQEGPRFYPYHGDTLEANHAYLITNESDDTEYYTVDLTSTGIEKTEDHTENKYKMYDLSGRHIYKTTKGIYITNGKKLYIR